VGAGRRRHLRPNPEAPVSSDAVLPGDPVRALRLAQDLLEDPVMSNHARGLWGYTGAVSGGSLRSLTVQSTGIGAASGAVVLTELAELGVERTVRLGTCRAVEVRSGDPEPEPGTVLVVERALAIDGVSVSLCEGRVGAEVEPDRDLTRALADSGIGRTATVAGIDPTGHIGDRSSPDPIGDEAVAADLQAAALIATGNRCGVAVACICLVAESSDGSSYLDDDEVTDASVRIGKAVVEVLEDTSK